MQALACGLELRGKARLGNGRWHNVSLLEAQGQCRCYVNVPCKSINVLGEGGVPIIWIFWGARPCEATRPVALDQ